MTTTTDDQRRFRALFEAHRAAVLAYARRRVGPDAAADVVADTFLVAWRRRDEIPGDPLPWLYGVARRTVANQRRSHRRSEALIDRLAAGGPVWAPPPDHALDRSDDVRRALAVLSERDREALLLVAWEGLDAQRAARAVGCSRGTFAVRLHRARRRFAAALAHERPDVPMIELEVTHET